MVKRIYILDMVDPLLDEMAEKLKVDKKLVASIAIVGFYEQHFTEKET